MVQKKKFEKRPIKKIDKNFAIILPVINKLKNEIYGYKSNVKSLLCKF